MANHRMMCRYGRRRRIPEELPGSKYILFFLADSARSDHQGEQVTSSGLAAETPAGVLLHQTDGEVRQQFARGGTHHGTRSLSLHLQAQINTRRAVEQRTVHHDVISAFRAAAP